MLSRYHAETVKLGELDVEIYVEAHEEDTAIEGNACACGECEPDCDTVARKFAERYAPWGWCAIRVVATVDGSDIEGDDWLGGCAYKSGKDFVDSKGQCVAPGGAVTYSGYYDDMMRVALEEVRKALRSSHAMAVRAGLV